MDKIGTKNNWEGKPKLFPCSLLLFPVLSTLNLFASSHTVYIAALLSITVIRHRSQCITNSSIYKQNIDNKQLVGNAQVSLNLPSYFTYICTYARNHGGTRQQQLSPAAIRLRVSLQHRFVLFPAVSPAARLAPMDGGGGSRPTFYFYFYKR